jgi:RNA polymerase sigma factor (sigma-70 family)
VLFARSALLAKRAQALDNRAMEGSPLSDEQLAQGLAGRDDSPTGLQAARAACEQLYARHARKLLAFLAARVPRSILEDLHQEVWRRVWQHAPSGFRGGNFRAWLHTLARNCIIDQRRKRTTDTLPESSDPADPRNPGGLAILLEGELHAVLKACLEKVAAEGAALVRARLGGESYQDICARTGIAPQRAHKLFHETKLALQTCVDRSLT